jgi:hypothetical protein
MFEQMGATVSYDPASKTADVSKPGSDVKVTVGKPEVVINGESRPLDVPPEIYKGADRRPGSRHLRRHGRLRPVGSREAVVVVRYIPGAADSAARDACSHPGSDPRSDARPDPGSRPPPPTVPPTPAPKTRHYQRSSWATTSFQPQDVQRVQPRQHRQEARTMARLAASSSRSLQPGLG